VTVDDLIDWADVAALGAYGKELAEWDDSGPVRAVIGRDGQGWLPLLDDIAAALREAHEAGLREGRRERARFTPAETAERMLMVRDVVEDQYAAIREENRALREEVARLCRELEVHSE
jgi:hypothetical protein